jgi:chromosomal replication initiator protein
MVSLENNSLTLSVPNSYYIEKINKDYLGLINTIYGQIFEKDIKISFITAIEKEVPKEQEIKKLSDIKNATLSNSGLNSQYQFENFIKGPCNQFAHAASMAVGEKPALAYNPLFLYGGVGLGKTHLMQAIGNLVEKNNSSLKVIYLSSETFVNDLITSMQRDRMSKFREKYRTIDVLLVDDIHFFAGKERTQEEFFHTFNTLYETKKQIVISSDKYPREIPKLEERLRSRFEWGLIADIQPPEFETKVAILRQKAEFLQIYLPDDVSEYIASKVKTNIRELEGCLSRLVAVSSLSGKKLSIDLAKETFKNIFLGRDKEVDIGDVQKATSEFFGLRLSDMKSKKRDRNIAIPRQIAMYLSKELTNHSLANIGKSFGGKDHTTVIHAVKKVEKNLKEDNELVASVKQIKRNLELL